MAPQIPGSPVLPHFRLYPTRSSIFLFLEHFALPALAMSWIVLLFFKRPLNEIPQVERAFITWTLFGVALLISILVDWEKERVRVVRIIEATRFD